MSREMVQTYSKTRELVLAALFAALTAVMGYVKIPLPFTPVPITGQTFAVMLAGSLLKPRTAVASMLSFLFLGAIGLPIFAGGQGGIGVIAGPTGGYLLSWPIAVFFMSVLLNKIKPNFINLLIINVLGGIIVVYTIGVFQLSVITGMNIKQAVAAGAVPFIPGDIIKAFVAALLALKLKPIVSK
ncbi:MAG: biotin transport system substrate-specific component [Thermosediminibacterales bacterium]|nr:biotin transport system substrate-specific component [Thermosediminibacterales bacterium]MDK2835540.1 biotin transport system substrate-specific component [Thermosediminibacterales bacterium]